VGAADDFFDLGGQSLKVIQVRARLVHRFGVDVPMRALFEHTTVAAQARLIASLVPRPDRPAARIPRLPDAAPYPLSHAQPRLWFLHHLDPGDRLYNLGN